MLVHFRVGNYPSFDQVVTLSAVGPSPRDASDSHVVTVQRDLSLFRTLALCGDTASGKTNLSRAFQFMARFVRRSVQPHGARPARRNRGLCPTRLQ